MVEGLPLLRLLQFTSQSFPIGAFAYSQGLEGAIDRGWVTDEEGAATWIGGQLATLQAHLEVPLLARFHSAWDQGDDGELARWLDVQLALREARELREEDLKLGRSMMRTLGGLGVARALGHAGPISWVGAYALAAHHFEVPLADAAHGFLYAFVENQCVVASRLVPLGQQATQRVMAACLAHVPRAVESGLAIGDDDLGLSAPAHGIACMGHEAQYSRLFLS